MASNQHALSKEQIQKCNFQEKNQRKNVSISCPLRKTPFSPFFEFHAIWWLHFQWLLADVLPISAQASAAAFGV